MNPRDLNYRMPPEWMMHERTFVAWPVADSMCYRENYESTCRGYAEIIKGIAEFEPVTVLINEGDREKAARLISHKNAELLVLEHNDAWIRDNGPTFIINSEGQIGGVDWQFNAWGEKYPEWELDNQVSSEILKQFSIPMFKAPLVMEGGSIHVDGEGTLLTTEECLLNPNRNPDLTREEIEQYLKAYLNVQRVIWLKKGLSGDETDGHVDNMACFAAPGKVIMQVCRDQDDENYEITRQNIEILNHSRDARGRKLEIIPIEQPPRVFYQGKRLTLSYLNFYFVNGGIVLPVFGEETTDQKAIQTLQTLFPARLIRPVDGMAIVREGGNVHCITQQMPRQIAGKEEII